MKTEFPDIICKSHRKLIEAVDATHIVKMTD